MTPAALAALHRACFSTPRPWRAEEFAAFLADRTCTLTTCPGGFALTRLIADEAELLTIAVAPEHRRRGLASALLARAMDTAAQGGARRLFLEVAADNDAALALYASAGFAITGRRPRYYSCPDGSRKDARILAARLPRAAAEFSESG